MNSFGWVRLVETCQVETKDKINRDEEYENNLKNKCTAILVQMHLNFTDIREWHYFFLSLYTKIINNKHQIQPLLRQKLTSKQMENIFRNHRQKKNINKKTAGINCRMENNTQSGKTMSFFRSYFKIKIEY
jgi:hypothetical protein